MRGTEVSGRDAPRCVVREAKRLGRASPKSGERRSLRKIAAELAKIGDALAATGLPSAKEAARAYFARNGQPYSAKSVRAMLAQRVPGETQLVSELTSGTMG